jgi:hypothetical protein
VVHAAIGAGGSSFGEPVLSRTHVM